MIAAQAGALEEHGEHVGARLPAHGRVVNRRAGTPASDAAPPHAPSHRDRRALASRRPEDRLGLSVARKALASVVKVHGEDGVLRVGDEFTVRMPGPSDGPVRVVEADGACFALDGHLEAARIRFSAHDLGRGALEVRIEASARGGDRLSNLLFDRLPFNEEVQPHMWISVLERLIKLPGGTRDGRVEISTRRVDRGELAHAR